ncbi:MAG TPA: dCTP deaminase [Candidatus Lokiarchaeia archaeon]|nr:dCTP deaminase [Candidatus Lokiarchaeia archaeon]
MISEQEIEGYLDEGKLIVSNYDKDCIEAASYDFRLGDEGIISSEKKVINVKEIGFITIKPLDFAVFTTFEEFDIPDDIVGNIGMKSIFAKQGLILLAGLQIDPGFKGVLIIRVYNTGLTPITIRHSEKVGMAQFLKLNEPTKRPYDKPRQLHIPSDDIMNIMKAESISIGKIIETLNGVSSAVIELKNSQQSLVKIWEEKQKSLDALWTQRDKKVDRNINVTVSLIGVLVAIFAVFCVIIFGFILPRIP